MINYGFTKELDIPYAIVIERAKDALKKEGFGVLTEINVKGKMKEKLGLDMRKWIADLFHCSGPENEGPDVNTERKPLGYPEEALRKGRNRKGRI